MRNGKNFWYCLNLLVLLLLSPVVGIQRVQSFKIAAFTLPGGPILLFRLSLSGSARKCQMASMEGFGSPLSSWWLYFSIVVVWLQKEYSPFGTKNYSLFWITSHCILFSSEFRADTLFPTWLALSTECAPSAYLFPCIWLENDTLE